MRDLFRQFAAPNRAFRVLAVLALGVSCGLGASACGDDSEAPPQTSANATAPASVSPYHLATDGKALVGPEDQRFPIRAEAITGYADSIGTDGETVYVSGWGVTGDSSKPAEQAVGFVAGKGISDAKISGNRPDVVEAYDQPALKESGFVLSFTKASLDCSEEAGGLEIFAIVEGVAGPITWAEGSPKLLTDEAC